MELPARQIHPGVWKFNFGAPGKIMPVATRHCPPAAAGLDIMGYLYLGGPIDPAPTRARKPRRNILCISDPTACSRARLGVRI
jgi:hypothetical protein